MTWTPSRRTVNALAVMGMIASAVMTHGLADAPGRPRSTLASAIAAAQPAKPRPPLLPANFQGRGRYIVPDLGITVPFTWQGRNGDSQMIAGGPRCRGRSFGSRSHWVTSTSISGIRASGGRCSSSAGRTFTIRSLMSGSR